MKNLYENEWETDNFSADYEDAHWQIRQLEK